MIGKIVKDGQQIAEMDDEGVWQSPDALLARMLNAVYSPRLPEFAGPGAGTFGCMAISRAAESVQGEAVIEVEPDQVPPRPARAPDISLDPDEEAALDRLWQKIERDGLPPA
jgi:hypothetical protein